MGPLEIVVVIFTTAFAVAGMQFKNMKIILISQIAANALLVIQYIIKGTVSAGYSIIVAIVQVVISYILGLKNIRFPVWLTGCFIVIYTVITFVAYEIIFDVFACIALWFFAMSVVQTESYACRFCATINTILWLVYDIGCKTWGTVITHSVILVFLFVAIFRLDIPEYRNLFGRIKEKLSGKRNA